MMFQGIALGLMAVFYGCYFIKLLSQKKKGIRTTQIGAGKTGFAKAVECTMMVSTILTPLAELVCIFSDCSFFPTWIRWLGAAIGAIGAVLFILAVLAMKDSWRAGVPEKDKTGLITGGVFQISRNPAFLGFDLLYLGILLMFFHWTLLAISGFAALMFHLQIVNVEEDFLLNAFGEEYLLYKKTVNRYFGRK